jgi:hypothetical protein
MAPTVVIYTVEYYDERIQRLGRSITLVQLQKKNDCQDRQLYCLSGIVISGSKSRPGRKVWRRGIMTSLSRNRLTISVSTGTNPVGIGEFRQIAGEGGGRRTWAANWCISCLEKAERK